MSPVQRDGTVHSSYPTAVWSGCIWGGREGGKGEEGGKKGGREEIGGRGRREREAGGKGREILMETDRQWYGV